jgi:hypothetical protein
MPLQPVAGGLLAALMSMPLFAPGQIPQRQDDLPAVKNLPGSVKKKPRPIPARQLKPSFQSRAK